MTVVRNWSAQRARDTMCMERDCLGRRWRRRTNQSTTMKKKTTARLSLSVDMYGVKIIFKPDLNFYYRLFAHHTSLLHLRKCCWMWMMYPWRRYILNETNTICCILHLKTGLDGSCGANQDPNPLYMLIIISLLYRSFLIDGQCIEEYKNISECKYRKVIFAHRVVVFFICEACSGFSRSTE